MSGSALDRFSRAVPIADAVLWEGYVLYPYRASAAKNRLRFNWGVVGPAEEPTMASTIVVEPGAAQLHVRVRFLHLIARDDGWDEADPATQDLVVDVAQLASTPQRSELWFPASVEVAEDGTALRRAELTGTVTVTEEPLSTGPADDGDSGARHRAITITVENTTSFNGTDRNDALRSSMIGCHVLVAADTDVFVSVLEPPEHLSAAVDRLRPHRAWPVLIGPAPARDLVLASPVILYDYPAVAPESVGDFYDGTEIDEMLALRVHTLTDEEKAEARALDPRSRAIIDRHDALEPVTMEALHGTVRAAAPVDPNPEWSRPGPNEALVAGVWVGPGSKVRLAPQKRSDVHDMFLKGRVPTVAEVVHDVDGEIHVAVTIDDDPGADLFGAQRRFLYFGPDELHPERGLDG